MRTEGHRVQQQGEPSNCPAFCEQDGAGWNDEDHEFRIVLMVGKGQQTERRDCGQGKPGRFRLRGAISML